MSYIVRNESEKDIEQVRVVVRAAFPTEVESKLVDVLRANGKAVISLVAVNGEEMLGHILFSPVSTSPPGTARGLGLAPVAVRPGIQKQGIGSRLILDGLCICGRLNYDYCVVLGDPKYYHRFGFEKASPFGLRNEYGVDDEFMVIRFSHRQESGLVRYAPEFAELAV